MRTWILLLLLLLPVPGGAPLPGAPPAEAPLVPRPFDFGPGTLAATEPLQTGPLPAVMLTEVLAHAPRDNEYLVLERPAGPPVDLEGWRLTDGEGTWILPSLLLRRGNPVRVAQNATALWHDGALEADLCVVGCPRPVATIGAFALANGGDGVLLRSPGGGLVDAYLYGETEPETGWDGPPAPALPRGRVAARRVARDLPVDTDRAEDWPASASLRLGQTRRPPARFPHVALRPFATPEAGADVLLPLLDAAREEILLAGFTLTHPGVGRALERALARGIPVTLGIEGRPPGGVPEEAAALLCRLQARGASVWTMGTGDAGWRRYALHHAKYAVVDDRWALVGSENFSPSGYPEEGRGNRGWGVLLRDPNLAGWLRALAQEDWSPTRHDVAPWAPCPAGYPPVDVGADPGPFPGVPTRGNVTVLLGPDNARGGEGVPALLDGASRRVDLALFYLRRSWPHGPNRLLESLLGTASRGVPVRVLLDGTYYNLAGEEDNDETVAWLNDYAGALGLSLEARLFRPGLAAAKLHNKGALVDGEVALVSSMNWNWAGAAENREVALVVESRAVAAHLQRGFEADWRRSEPGGAVAVDGPARTTVGRPTEYRARLTGAGAPPRLEWFLEGDGAVAGTDPVFVFTPSASGPHLLRLRVLGTDGSWRSARLWVDVREPWPILPPSSLPLLALGTGLAAVVWGWRLRTRGEPTNKSGRETSAWPSACRSPPARSRSTPTVP